MVAARTGAMPPRNGRTRALQRCLGISTARPGDGGMGSGVATRVGQATSRRVEHGEGDESHQGRHTVQQRFDGAGTREVEEQTVFVLLDLRGDYEEGQGHARWADARAVRCWWRRRASCMTGAAWRSKTALPARPQTNSMRCRCARTSITSGVVKWLSPRTRIWVRGQWRRRKARSLTKIMAFSAPMGRVPGRRQAVTKAPESPSKIKRGK